MSLGFTVDKLVQAGRGGIALRMGLTRVSEQDWLWRDFDRAARVQVFAEHPESLCVLDRAEAAAKEAALLAGGAGDLGDAAASCWEDLCVLEADGQDGPYRLTAGAVAFPTDWRLEEKMGQPLGQIHTPIHGYAQQLSASVDNFFRKLRAGPIFGRANWFVVPTRAWRYLPDGDPVTRFAHVNADNAGDTLFLRCERQTLRRLPVTGAVLFTIGVAVAPLRHVGIAALRRVAGVIAALSGGEQERRAAPFYADAFARYTAAREGKSLGATA